MQVKLALAVKQIPLLILQKEIEDNKFYDIHQLFNQYASQLDVLSKQFIEWFNLSFMDYYNAKPRVEPYTRIIAREDMYMISISLHELEIEEAFLYYLREALEQYHHVVQDVLSKGENNEVVEEVSTEVQAETKE